MSPEPRFNFHASTIFLTYAQCTLSKEELLLKLHELFAIKEYCIAKELHSDGHPHLHAFLKLESKIHKRIPSFADVEGFHPNITSPRSIKAVITYVQKDNDFIASEGINELLNKKSYGQLIAEATSTGEFLTSVEKYFPRDMVLNYERIKVYAENKFAEEVPEYVSPYKPEDFIEHPEMIDWATQIVRPQCDPKVFFYSNITNLPNPSLLIIFTFMFV